jgi:hypothetical protein
MSFYHEVLRNSAEAALTHPKTLLKFSGPDKKVPEYSASFELAPTGKVNGCSDFPVPHERSYFCQTGNCVQVLEVKPPVVALFDLLLQAQEIQARQPVCLGRKRPGNDCQLRKFYWMYFVLLHQVKTA